MRLKLLYFLPLIFLSTKLLGQLPAFASNAIERFEDYQKKAWTENLYIASDQAAYIAGEQIRYSIFCRANHQEECLSRVVYIGLMNAQGDFISKQTCTVRFSGSADGCIDLPDNLTSGGYRLVAFTAWMRNKGPWSYGLRTISITNAVKDLYTQAIVPPCDSTVAPPSMFGDSNVKFEVQNSEDSIRVSLVCKDSAAVAIYNSGKMLFSTWCRDSGCWRLPVEKLLPGVNIAIAFNREKQLSERLFYLPPLLKAEFQGLEKVYKKRSRVDLQIKLRSTDLKPFNGNFSIAVFRSDSEGADSTERVVSYLGSKLFFASPCTTHTNIVNDLLRRSLVVEGNWQNIMDELDYPEEFALECDGPIYRGKILDTTSSKTSIMLSYPGWDVRLQPVEYQGERNIIMEPYQGAAFPFLLSPSKPKAIGAMYWDDPFTDAAIKSGSIYHQNMQKGEIDNRYMALQIRRSFNGESPKISNVDTSTFHTTILADETIDLHRFKRFETMQEVFQELVKSVMVRRRSRQLQLFVVSAYDNQFLENPLLLINGCPVNIEQVMSLNPESVLRIAVVNTPYLVGTIRLNGIISISSTANAEPGISTYSSPEIFDNSRHPIFVPICYDSPEKLAMRMPDFRQLIHWTPSISLDQNGMTNVQFYTGDLSGQFILKMEGINATGVPVMIQKKFVIR